MPLRIFIVEDHVETLKAVQAYLERRGHEVETATLMQEALTQWSAENFDLLLADIGLPDGDGWEMMRLLRKNPPRYAAAMSGYGTPADIAHSQSVGFKRHLVKPVRHEDLDAVVAEAQAMKDGLSEG
ncbi:Response regulator receiver domain-containing protein [Prosthecobacter debontii]|uniref:Response regulator receiver domain-containing protein n=1 Tax=Prosthecobacter debontii TaxID=48467 RepID=A0A1T4Z5F3_9BACT|nr:response regulator [Prosthecobacter debontii]SKB09088.1 Response regulator receiver domain-containing protein [Prosthecobacter debontii]